jgi:type I restriction-modification system DNA methylase subunit
VVPAVGSIVSDVRRLAAKYRRELAACGVSNAELFVYTAWTEALSAVLAGRGVAASAELCNAETLCGFFKELGARIAGYDWAAAPGADLLGQVYRQIAPKEARKRLGEFYTPDWVVRLMLWRALYLLVRGRPPDKALPRSDAEADGEAMELIDEYYERRGAIPSLVDPTCGSFAFGVRYIDMLIKWRREKRRMPPEELAEEVLANVVGIDVNPVAAAAAKANYLLQLYRLLGGARLPRPDPPILNLDLLNLKSFPRRFDLVAGNLPWVNVSELPADRREAAKDAARRLGVLPSGPAAGKMDLSIPLFAVALTHLAESGGVVTLMVPATVFRGVHGARWRELLARHELAEVWDLTGVKPFEDAEGQPGIVFLKRR